MLRLIRSRLTILLAVFAGWALGETAHIAWRWYVANAIHPHLMAEGLEAGRHAAFVERAKRDNIDLLFISDSLTDWFKDAPAWSLFAGPRTSNYGMMGDTTAGLLWRVKHGEIDGLAPRVVIVQIGTNDLDNLGDSAIVAGVKMVLGAIRDKCHSARLLLIGIMPRNDGGRKKIDRIRSINTDLKRISGVSFLDLSPVLSDADGYLAKECSAEDGVHITPEGYRRWADAMQPVVGQLMNDSMSR